MSQVATLTRKAQVARTRSSMTVALQEMAFVLAMAAKVKNELQIREEASRHVTRKTGSDEPTPPIT